MGLLLLYLFIALFFSFLCSVLEAVLLSITPSFISITTQKDPDLGKDLQGFKENVDRPLAAILTLNTFAHTIGAAGVGAQAQRLWGDAYLSLTSGVLTLIILFFSEIIPKTIGANHWKRLAPMSIRTIKILIYSPLYPIILLSQFITKRMKKDKGRSVLSRADFTAMAEIGIKQGIFQDSESQIIRNILRFNKIMVRHIMTPRTVVVSAQEDMPIIEFFTSFPDLRFSRIPIYRENLDDVTGYVLKDEVMYEMIQNQGDKPLKSISRNIQVVPEHMPIPTLFTSLLERKDQIALVVDEYGGTAGLISMEDIIETLLGMEIIDELDQIADLQTWARDNWEKRAKRLGFKMEE